MIVLISFLKFSAFLLQEIAYLERELYDLQSNTVGVIGGMKIDIR